MNSKSTLIKYGIVLGFLFLVNNYIQIIPFFDRLIDDGMNSIIALLIIAVITMIGVNEYVKKAYVTKSYNYVHAVGIGIGMNFLGATIYASVSTLILILNNVDVEPINTLISRILRFTLIGSVVSLIIPLTYKSKQEN